MSRELLCAVCLYEVCPPNISMQGSFLGPNGGGAVDRENVESLVGRGMQLTTVDGRVMPMLAVVTYQGTSMCVRHLQADGMANIERTGRL